MYIAVDAFGGDNAPLDIIKGVIQAVEENEGFNIYLVGDNQKISSILDDLQYKGDRIEIVDAQEVITMHDSPATAVRTKPNSSLAICYDLVSQKKAQAIVSAGNTGAILSGAIFKLGRIKGVVRPALAPFIPCLYGKGKSQSLILDVGANADCKPEYLIQFAFMASEYLRIVFGNTNPKVGLINIGSEEGKGNQLTKTVYENLKKSNLNFVGNIESREILKTDCDIMVTDGFTGNIILKFMEGMASAFMGEMKNALMGSAVSKVGAMLAKPQLKKMKKQFDYEEFGAAILLGVDGGVFKCHGSSGPKAIKNGILQAARFVDGDVINIIKENMICIER